MQIPENGWIPGRTGHNNLFMIKLDGVPSILEGIYLGEELSPKLQNITVEVNPALLRHVTKKTVVINSRDYRIPDDTGYGNTIITRLREVKGAIYQPYLPRILPGVMWNGMVVKDLPEALKVYYYDNGVLYFPKIHGYVCHEANLDWLGYIQYQLGYNFYNSPFKDLDILKCRGGLF